MLQERWLQRGISSRTIRAGIAAVTAVAAASGGRAQTTTGVATRATGPVAGRPALRVDNAVRDFGTTWLGTELRHTFRITNAGDATLKITGVRPGCRCTVAEGYPRELEPGQSGEFTFTLNSHDVRGRYEKTIAISSNDPEQPETTLRLRGECRWYVEVNPPHIGFGTIQGEQPQERVARFVNNADTPFVPVVAPSPVGGRLRWEMVEVRPGRVYDLHVITVPPYRPGALDTKILVTTNFDQQKTIELNVNGRVPERIEVTPASVQIADMPAGGAAAPRAQTRYVQFTNNGRHPVTVLEATVNDPNVAVTLRPVRAGHSYTVQLALPAGYVPPPEGRTLTLKTDDAEKPVLTVPISRFPVPRAPTTAPPTQPAATTRPGP